MSYTKPKKGITVKNTTKKKRLPKFKENNDPIETDYYYGVHPKMASIGDLGK